VFRTSLREMVMVGAVASIVALVGTGTATPKWLAGFANLGRSVEAAVCCVRSGLDGMMTAPEPKSIPGPVCVLVATDGTIIGLDRAGLIATADTVCLRADLPVMTGFVPTSAIVGEAVPVAEVVVGMAVLRAFESKPEMLKGLSEINLRDIENPKVFLRGGVVVDLGSGRYKLKVERLGQVLGELKRLGAKPKTIDLRFARQVVVRCNEPVNSVEKEV
jgi:hypothetical protein